MSWITAAVNHKSLQLDNAGEAMKGTIHNKPFLTSWPTPLSFKDLVLAFRGKVSQSAKRSRFRHKKREEEKRKSIFNNLFTFFSISP